MDNRSVLEQERCLGYTDGLDVSSMEDGSRGACGRDLGTENVSTCCQEGARSQ